MEEATLLYPETTKDEDGFATEKNNRNRNLYSR